VKPAWCSEAGSRLSIRLACLLFCLVIPGSPVWSHADILLQIESLDAQLTTQPENAELLLLRGDLYRRHGDYAAAARDFAAARLAEPDLPLLDFHEGRLLLEAGNPSAAEKLFDRYILGHPEEANAFILRAEVRLALGQSLEAARDYAEAIQRASQASPALYREWALALVGAGDVQWSAARSVVDIGLDQFSQDVSLLALGTDIALAENQPGYAAAYIERLPPALANLPRWQDRVSTLQCLTSSVAEDDARLCLAAARNELEIQARR